MKTGEYIFNNIEHIKINRPLINNLYVSALYFEGNKYILEVLAPTSSAPTYDEKCEEYHQRNVTNGDRWTNSLKASMAKAEVWPLENANYYIEVNDMKIGKNQDRAIYFRYEPNNIKDSESQGNIEKANQNTCGELNRYEIIKPIKNGVTDALKSIFEDKEFRDATISMICSMPAIDVGNTDDDEEYRHLKYTEDKNNKQKEFFNKFRKSVTIPDYLNNESIMIADVIFRGKNIPCTNKITDLKFVLERYQKYYLTRINLQLPFGEYEKPVEISSKKWDMFTSKIAIEGVIQRKKEDKDGMSNIPDGTKGIFIVYETVDNVLVHPIFYTTEVLKSYNSPKYKFVNRTKLLKDKGIKGFNKYITFAGHVDENTNIADIELFQLTVTYECNKKFILQE